MLKIALPNKGRLSQKIFELLNNAGLNLDSKDERCLKLDTKVSNIFYSSPILFSGKSIISFL